MVLTGTHGSLRWLQYLPDKFSVFESVAFPGDYVQTPRCNSGILSGCDDQADRWPLCRIALTWTQAATYSNEIHKHPGVALCLMVWSVSHHGMIHSRCLCTSLELHDIVGMIRRLYSPLRPPQPMNEMTRCLQDPLSLMPSITQSTSYSAQTIVPHHDTGSLVAVV
jgi:hypothetical protein